MEQSLFLVLSLGSQLRVEVAEVQWKICLGNKFFPDFLFLSPAEECT